MYPETYLNPVCRYPGYLLSYGENGGKTGGDPIRITTRKDRTGKTAYLAWQCMPWKIGTIALLSILNHLIVMNFGRLGGTGLVRLDRRLLS